MSSSKQKRQKLKLTRAKKKKSIERAELLAGLARETIIPIDRMKIVSRSACPTASHYYRDTWFTCKDCGKDELWTAKQQQRWYEEQGGEIEAIAVRCRACRRKEKLRRETARKIHLEGIARKRSASAQKGDRSAEPRT